MLSKATPEHKSFPSWACCKLLRHEQHHLDTNPNPAGVVRTEQGGPEPQRVHILANGSSIKQMDGKPVSSSCPL